MTPAQQTAFAEGGGGGFFSADYLLETIILVSVATLVTHTAWIIYKSYGEFGSRKIKPGEMVTLWVRAIFMLMLGSYMFIN